MGTTVNDTDTFLQISDQNISPFDFTIKVKDNAGAELLSLKEDGNLYIHQLTEATTAKALYIDPSTKLVTFGDPTGSGVTTLTAGATSGIDVDGTDTSSDASIEVSQNDNKLNEVTIDVADYIGFWDVTGGVQAKATLGDFPG